MKYKNLVSAILISVLPFYGVDAALAQTNGVPSPFDGKPVVDQSGFYLGFGDDNRVAMKSSAYPWSAIGQVQIDGGGHCTGTLIGQDLVVTNAHCIWSNGKLRATFFAPNYKNGQSSERVRAIYYWWGTSNPNQARGADWAIIRLERKIGSRYGYFGWQSLNNQSLKNKKVIYAGYSTFRNEKVKEFIGGQTAQVHINCTVRDVYSDVIHTDCDNGRGGSGGPIFVWQNNQPILVGINAAEYRQGGEESYFQKNYTPGEGNVGVPVRTFAKTIQSVKKSLGQ